MVKVKNIYHMLSYAYQNLRHIGYSKLAVEEFNHIHDLMATILVKGVGTQLKEGLTHDYENVSEVIAVPRGKIDFAETVRTQALLRHKVACNYSQYSENNIYNQILKATMRALVLSKDVKLENKKELKKLLLFFGDVDDINYDSINWDSLGYHKNSNSYRLLMNICFMVIKGLLLTTTEGTYQLAQYLDDQHIYKLYEKFVLSYCQKEHPELKAKAPYIEWNSYDGYIEFLPQMKSDIVLYYGERKLIIDTKYYSKSMRASQFGTHETMISSNLYQIFTYVKNMDKDNDGSVSGLLLYAKTDEDVVPNNRYRLAGNKISVHTLDLDAEWNEITAQLEKLILAFKYSEI